MLLIFSDPVIFSKLEISRKKRKILSSDVVLLMNKPYPPSYHTEQVVARARNSDSSDESSDDLSGSLCDSSSKLY